MSANLEIHAGPVLHEGKANNIASAIRGKLPGLAHSAGAAFVCAYSPATETDLEMVDAQLEAARTATAPTSYILPATATLISIANINWVPALNLILWPVALTILSVICEIAYLRFLKTFDHSPAAIRARARLALAIAAVLMTAWCSMVVVLWAPGILGNHLLLIFILCASLSGWVSTSSIYLPMIGVTLPIYLVAMTAVPAISGDVVDAVLAWLNIGFWVMMAAQSFSNYKANVRKMRFEGERAVLIENMKHAKEASDRARERAEAASRAKSTFLANMSHELRTPLNAILGFSEIIKTRAFGESIDQYAEYGGYIHGSGQHLLTLINDILDLAKIEAGRMTLREEEIDLSRIAGDAVEMMAIRAQQAGVKLEIEFDGELPYVYADERAARQIIVNLISNAIKFTPLGGDVKVFVHKVDDGRMAFGVSDTGIGIAPDDHRRVFESFGQGRYDAVQADKSTGLGLPIVKGLAEAHGGTITLESAPDLGTRVTIFLPTSRLRPRDQALRAAG